MKKLQDGLDEVDKEILDLLQKGYLTPRVNDIAEKLELRPSTVSYRIKRLEEKGVINGYTATLDPEKVNRGFLAFVFGQAALGPITDLDRPGEKLAKIPEVQEVHFITGEWDYLIKFRVKDQQEYYRIVQEIAKCFEGRGLGMVVPKTFKETTYIPLRENAEIEDASKPSDIYLSGTKLSKARRKWR